MRLLLKNNKRFMKNEAYIADTLRIKLRKLMREGQSPEDIALTSGVTLLYTKGRKKVYPETDIRTDKWQVAQDAMQRAYNNSIKAKSKGETREETDPTQGAEDTPSKRAD